LAAKKVHEVGKRVSNTRIALRNIVAATDFSAHSVSVLTHAAAIARRYRSKVYVAHVIPTDVYKSVPAEVMEEALKQTRAYVQDAMANQLRLKFLQAVHNEPVIKEGQVAPELLKLVAEHNIDLLVIGTRGHHGLDRLLQGSVAEELFRQAPCPVLIVPPTASEQSGIPVRTILYPTSFSENSLRAAPYAFSLARRHRARLILLHVSVENTITSQEDLARLRAAGEERLRQLLPAKGGPSREPMVHVDFGAVEEKIVRVAVENHADLIVLGIATAGAAAAHLAEGITYKVIGAAPCPVLTIRG
jgi:nucleotide-binding universal stress UspA family protein